MKFFLPGFSKENHDRLVDDWLWDTVRSGEPAMLKVTHSTIVTMYNHWTIMWLWVTLSPSPSLTRLGFPLIKWLIYLWFPIINHPVSPWVIGYSTQLVMWKITNGSHAAAGVDPIDDVLRTTLNQRISWLIGGLIRSMVNQLLVKLMVNQLLVVKPSINHHLTIHLLPATTINRWLIHGLMMVDLVKWVWSIDGWLFSATSNNVVWKQP